MANGELKLTGVEVGVVICMVGVATVTFSPARNFCLCSISREFCSIRCWVLDRVWDNEAGMLPAEFPGVVGEINWMPGVPTLPLGVELVEGDACAKYTQWKQLCSAAQKSIALHTEVESYAGYTSELHVPSTCAYLMEYVTVRAWEPYKTVLFSSSTCDTYLVTY